jgi:hypothetical protein
MSGLVIDIIVEFLFRIMARIFNEIRSQTWPVVTAKVTGSGYVSADYGCDVAVIRYEYSMAGERYEGVYKKPFIFKNYGEAYPHRFPNGVDYPVRVKPGGPSTSVPVSTQDAAHSGSFDSSTSCARAARHAASRS